MANIPHYLNVHRTNSHKMDREHFTNNSLRRGIVTKMFPPLDTQNRNKQYTEYDVTVTVRNGLNGKDADTTYRCVLANPLGGSDYIEYTLRADPTPKSSVSVGSSVLILCVNGETTNAVIITGLNNGNRSPSTGNLVTPNNSAEQAPFYIFHFNGVKFNVNSDGEMTLQAIGATQADGSPSSQNSDSNKGPLITFDKTGSISIDTNNGSTINLDSKSGNIDINSKGNITINADGNTKIGSSNAKEPLVLGNSLVSALSAFIDIFIQNALGFTLPGPVSPAGALQQPVLEAIAQWKLQYLTATPFLADDKFTE